MWIAEELGEDADEVYDVLLGTIKSPEDFVASVQASLADYDDEVEYHS
jgi:hypothetical protein